MPESVLCFGKSEQRPNGLACEQWHKPLFDREGLSVAQFGVSKTLNVERTNRGSFWPCGVGEYRS